MKTSEPSPQTTQKSQYATDGEFLSLVSLLDDPDVRVSLGSRTEASRPRRFNASSALDFIDLSQMILQNVGRQL